MKISLASAFPISHNSNFIPPVSEDKRGLHGRCSFPNTHTPFISKPGQLFPQNTTRHSDLLLPGRWNRHTFPFSLLLFPFHTWRLPMKQTEDSERWGGEAVKWGTWELKELRTSEFPRFPYASFIPYLKLEEPIIRKWQRHRKQKPGQLRQNPRKGEVCQDRKCLDNRIYYSQTSAKLNGEHRFHPHQTVRDSVPPCWGGAGDRREARLSSPLCVNVQPPTPVVSMEMEKPSTQKYQWSEAKKTLTENAPKGQGKGTPSKPWNLENSHFTPVRHHRIKPQSDQQRPRGEPKLWVSISYKKVHPHTNKDM